MKNISEILNAMPHLEKGQRWILGIDGLSRSGKTTYVNELYQQLQEQAVPVVIFHIDNFIVERNRRYHTGHPEWYEYYHLQWDVAFLKDHMFSRLKGSESLSLPFYEEAIDSHTTQAVVMPETCVILVEGVFLQRQEWRHYFDAVLYLDCPRDKRLGRESEHTKGHLEKFRQRYWPAEEYYLDELLPMKQADWVLEN